MSAGNSRTLRKPEVGDSINIVKNHIENCLKKHMNMEETMKYMWRVHSTSPRVTSILWIRLQEENVKAFRAYSPSRQAESMNSQNFTSGDPQAPRFDQNFQSVIHNQLTRFSEMTSTEPPSAIEFPQDSVPSYRPVGTPNNIVSVQNSWPEYILPDSSVMCQNFPVRFSSTFSGDGNMQNSYPEYRFPEGSLVRQNFPAGLSSTFSGDGNVPQLPMHDSSMLTPSNEQIVGLGYVPRLPMIHDCSMLPPSNEQIVGLGNVPQLRMIHDSSMVPPYNDQIVGLANALQLPMMHDSSMLPPLSDEQIVGLGNNIPQQLMRHYSSMSPPGLGNNIPQQPMMHDSSMLPPSNEQIVGLGNVPRLPMMHDSSMLPPSNEQIVGLGRNVPGLPMIHDSFMLHPSNEQIVGLGNVAQLHMMHDSSMLPPSLGNNIPQQPTMHDSFMSPPVKEDTVDMPFLQGYTARNTDLHLPMRLL